MALHLETIPYDTGIVEGKDDPISSVWYLWFYSLVALLTAAPKLLDTLSLSAQHASISTTPLPINDISGGYYRISVYARVTRSASTSSSLTVQLGWTENGSALVYPFPALTSNLTTAVLMQEIVVKADQAAPITYSTIYASVGATAMEYSLDIVTERVGATAA